VKNYSKSIIKQLLTPNSEIETIRMREDVTYKEQKKQGWISMYKDGYDKTIMCLKSDLEKSVFMQVRDMFTRSQTEVNVSQVKIAKAHKSTAPTISKIVKKLVDVGFLMKVSRGVYRMNPFVLVPYQADGLKLQKEWIVLNEGEKSC